MFRNIVVRVLGVAAALFLISGITVRVTADAQTVDQNEPSTGSAASAESLVQVWAVGSTGDEIIEIQVDGVTVTSGEVASVGNVWSYAAEPVPVTFSIPAVADHGRIRVAFQNDGLSAGNNRDLRIDSIAVDGTTYQTSDLGVESLGTWLNGALCTRGFFGSTVLACNGWFQLPAGSGLIGPVPVMQVIEVRAEGSTGEEQVELLIGDESVTMIELTTDMDSYVYEHMGTIPDDDIRVEFVNDRRFRGSDRNVQLDFIQVDEVKFETEEPGVFSTGTFTNGEGCTPGNKQSETLHCNGYFQFDVGATDGIVQPPALALADTEVTTTTVPETTTTTTAPETTTTTTAPETTTTVAPTTTTTPTSSLVNQFPNAPTGAEINQALGRGMNFGDSLDAPREGDWSVGLDESYFRIIAEAGFDHVRLPVSWAGYADTQAPYTIPDGVDPTINHPDYTNIWDRVEWAIDQAEANDLMIIVNMQHYDALHDDPAAHTDRLMAMWEQIAERYADVGDHLIFELLNEPHGAFGETPQLWNDLIVDLLSTIRPTNPTRGVLVGPVNYNTVSSLPDLVLPADDFLISKVHLYEPFNFTHQGAEWIEQVRPLGVPWTPEAFDFSEGIHDRSWDSRISTDGGQLRIEYDRQWAGFSFEFLESVTLQEISFTAVGDISLQPGCRDGDFEALNVPPIQVTNQPQQITIDLTSCPTSANGTGIMNANPFASTLWLSDIEICTVERGCEDVLTSADQALRRWVQLAAEWSATTGNPMYIAEFGSFSAAGQVPIADRAAWTATVVNEANRNNIPYSYWEFHSNFAAYDLASGSWNAQLLNALGG